MLTPVRPACGRSHAHRSWRLRAERRSNRKDSRKYDPITTTSRKHRFGLGAIVCLPMTAALPPSQMTFANRNTRQGDHAMDSINVKARRLAPLDTPTDLRSDATKDIAGALTLLLTDFFALYLKTKNFHWHMSGPHFRDYHLMLDDQGDQILAATDAIAERVRKIGGTTLRSIGQISRSQRLLDNDADYVTPHDMLAELREDNKQLIAFMRETHDLCDEGNDVASASLLENWIDEAEQRTWFLFEASRTSGSVGD
jgi:starvation-inducible DNA-binding protein